MSLGVGFADRHPRREPRGGDVLIEERGRDAQRRGDVVEAVDFDLGRQQCLGIELDAEQIVDRGRRTRCASGAGSARARARRRGRLAADRWRASSVASIHATNASISR